MNNKSQVKCYKSQVKHLVIIILLFGSCQENPKVESTKPKAVNHLPSPDFQADSAYVFIEEQVAFGPRVPNTKAHAQCASYLEGELKRFGFSTHLQTAQVKAYTGGILNINNIMGRYKPENPNRVLLFAHWDSRHIADRDTKDQDKPILGANDGASGVGVLLEIARLISNANNLNIGLDIIFFDAEDYGQPSEGMSMPQSNTWCLGSQYWANHIPFSNYNPRYGILLDMVGARNAQFPKEGNSMRYAPDVVDKVWNTARSLGYDYYFSPEVDMYGITDDHLYINTIAKIPSIDIIQYDVEQRDFGHFHHRHSDDMTIIDKGTLKAVGQTVLQVLYNE